MRFSHTGLAAEDPRAPLTAAGFADALMRGIGQVMLQNNSYAGLLFLAGIAWNAPLFALATVLGAVASTGTALLLSAKTEHIRNGLFGFNGALVGVAMLAYLQPTPLVWLSIILAASGSTIVTAGLSEFLKPWNLPALSAPFVLTSWCLFLATARLGQLQATRQLIEINLPQSAATAPAMDLAAVIDGVFNGVAQVFLQNNVATGVLFTIGLFISSRRAGVVALAGSLIGLLVAWAAGAPETAIHAGVFGFNNVLAAIALGSVFLAPGRAAMAYAALAMIATPVVDAAASITMQRFGLPSLTLPFVLSTWLFLLGGAVFPGIRLAGEPSPREATQ